MTNKPAKDEVAACTLCKEGHWPLKKYFDGRMMHFDQNIGMMAWYPCAAAAPPTKSESSVPADGYIHMGADRLRDLLIERDRELATVRAERDAAIANNTELEGKLAEQGDEREAAISAEQCLDFLDSLQLGYDGMFGPSKADGEKMAAFVRENLYGKV